MTSDQERVREAVAQMCRVILGKTTLAAAFSRVLGLDYRRIQFTPDVMPSDLTGFSIYRREVCLSARLCFLQSASGR